MTAPKPISGILDIQAYKGGNAEIDERSDIINLAANECALGPSPSAVEAYRNAAGSIGRYPDGGADQLRQALAQHYGLDANRLICGNGSDELISLLTQAYAGPGDEVLYSRHGFLMYGIAAKASGATPVVADETGYRADIDALLNAVTDRTRLVFLANPNNPTGSYLTNDELRRLREGLPENLLLVVDAAYAEYVSQNDYCNGEALARTTPNTVMTRTFSKIYGLAGLRIGWGYGAPDIIDVLHRVRGPFNVNVAAQAAAMAALNDVAHKDAAKTHNDIWQPWLADQLAALGLDILPSVGNFVLARFPGGPAQSVAADAALKQQNIFVRPVGAYGLPDALRVTVGTEAENHALIDTLSSFMEQG